MSEPVIINHIIVRAKSYDEKGKTLRCITTNLLVSFLQFFQLFLPNFSTKKKIVQPMQ